MNNKIIKLNKPVVIMLYCIIAWKESLFTAAASTLYNPWPNTAAASTLYNPWPNNHNGVVYTASLFLTVLFFLENIECIPTLHGGRTCEFY